MPGPLVSEGGGTCHCGQRTDRGAFARSHPPSSTTPSQSGEGHISPYAHSRTLSETSGAHVHAEASRNRLGRIRESIDPTSDRFNRARSCGLQRHPHLDPTGRQGGPVSNRDASRHTFGLGRSDGVARSDGAHPPDGDGRAQGSDRRDQRPSRGCASALGSASEKSRRDDPDEKPWQPPPRWTLIPMKILVKCSFVVDPA